MITETNLSQTDGAAFRPLKSVGRSQDCTPTTDTPLQRRDIRQARRLTVVPSRAVELTGSEEGEFGVDPSTGPSIVRVPRGGSRAVRRAVARQQRTDERSRRSAHIGLLDREAGMATAEYAIATLAAVGFAALLVAVLSSTQIKGLLTSLITTALNFG